MKFLDFLLLFSGVLNCHGNAQPPSRPHFWALQFITSAQSQLAFPPQPCSLIQSKASDPAHGPCALQARRPSGQVPSPQPFPLAPLLHVLTVTSLKARSSSPYRRASSPAAHGWPSSLLTERLLTAPTQRAPKPNPPPARHCSLPSLPRTSLPLPWPLCRNFSLLLSPPGASPSPLALRVLLRACSRLLACGAQPPQRHLLTSLQPNTTES